MGACGQQGIPVDDEVQGIKLLMACSASLKLTRKEARKDCARTERGRERGGKQADPEEEREREREGREAEEGRNKKREREREKERERERARQSGGELAKLCVCVCVFVCFSLRESSEKLLSARAPLSG